MENDKYLALTLELERLRAQDNSRSRGKNPPTIKLLRKMLQNSHDDARTIVLLSLLSRECRLLGLPVEEESIHRETVRRFPDAPMPSICLAEFFLYVKEDLVEAKKIIGEAIQIALKEGDFIRHAYNTLARIARKLEDYKLLEETIDKLTNYKKRPDAKDISYEYDFLEDLPKGMVDPEKIKRYKRLISSR